MLDFQCGDGSGSPPVSVLPNASQLLMSAAKNNSKRKRAGEGAGSSKGKGSAAGEEGRGGGGASQKVRRMFFVFVSGVVFICVFFGPLWGLKGGNVPKKSDDHSIGHSQECQETMSGKGKRALSRLQGRVFHSVSV